MTQRGNTPKSICTGIERATLLSHWMRGENVGVPVSTLCRWRAQVKGHPSVEWSDILTPKYKGRVVQATIPTEAWDYFKGSYLTLGGASLAECYRRTETAARQFRWGNIPSHKTFERRLNKEFKPHEIALLREGEEALDKYFPAQRRTVGHLEALQWVNADGHRLDIFAKDPQTEKPIRPMLWVWQDIYSRKVLSYLLDTSENTDQISRSFGAMLEEFGMWCGESGPQITIDNTRAAANKQMTGGIKTRFRYKFVEGEAKGILTALGYTVHWTSVDSWGAGRGQSKPIERAFRDLGVKIATASECYGCRTGNKPTAKPEDYGSRAIEWDLLKRVIDREVTAFNTQTGRRTETANGGSYEDAFRESYLGAKAAGRIREVGMRERRFFLLAADTKQAAKRNGEINLLGNRYWCEELIRWCGKEVVARYDPENLQQSIWVYDKDGNLIGAARCISDTGYNNTQAAREHARAKTQFTKATKKAAEAKRRMGERDIAALNAPLLPNAPDDTPIEMPIPVDFSDSEDDLTNYIAGVNELAKSG